MSSLWRVSKIRIGGFLAAGGVLVGLMMFIVLPALASTAGQPVPPPSTLGVMPIDVDTGGQSNDCAVFNSPAANQFRIANPKSKTYSTSVNGAPVTFTVKLNPDSATGLPGYANQKYMDVSSTGAAIVDIGIKGGNDETDYRYSGQPARLRHGRRRPARTCPGNPRGRNPDHAVQHQQSDVLLRRPRLRLGHRLPRRERERHERRQFAPVGVDGPPLSGNDAGQDHHVWFRRLVCVRVAAGDGVAVHRLRGAAFGKLGPDPAVAVGHQRLLGGR